jgi:hypothetical protein
MTSQQVGLYPLLLCCFSLIHRFLSDESELLSTRTLALTRYRRNHELMEEVFKQAAFGEEHCSLFRQIVLRCFCALGTKKSPPPKRIYEAFDKAELEAKAVRHKARLLVLTQFSLGQVTR